MKPLVFTGSAVAIVTPFKDSKVDFPAFDRLVAWQLQQGTVQLTPVREGTL